jgi:hypothetical protein
MNINDVIIYLILILVIIKIYNYLFDSKENFENKSTQYIFTYWENKNGRDEPYVHIKLCFDTMQKHLGNNPKYNFVILNDKTIQNYLPDCRKDLDTLLIAQKVDYYRVALLKKYGGIWLDADTIIMRDLDEIFDKLDKNFDFIGFGCTGDICFNGYPDPSNGVMASKPNGILISCVQEKLDKLLDKKLLLSTNLSKNPEKKGKFDYFEFGKKIIWECLDDLLKTDYKNKYYHFASEYDGSRDKSGKWIHTPEHFSTKKTELLNESKVMFVFLANYEIMNYSENKWILDLRKEELLSGPWFISKLYRKALN